MVMMEVLLLNLILPGMLGGLARGVVGVSKMIGRGGDFNAFRMAYAILVSTLVGALAAAVAGGDWRIGVLAGYAGGDFLEGLYRSGALRYFKGF